jgi:hypothetical protein
VIADAVGDAVYSRSLAEIDCEAAGPLQRGRVELEPARLAGTGETPVGDDDVRGSAGAGDCRPVDAVGRTGRKQAPFGATLPKQRDTGIVGAIACRLPFEQVGVAVEAGSLREQAADVIARAVPEQQWRSVVDHGQMAPVAGHEEVRCRGKRRGGAADGERYEAEQAQPRVPQA